MRRTNTFTRRKYRKYKSNAPNIKDNVYYKDTYCAVNFQTLYLYSNQQEGTAT